MLLGTGGLGLFVLCMLVCMAYPSTLANAGWKDYSGECIADTDDDPHSAGGVGVSRSRRAIAVGKELRCLQRFLTMWWENTWNS